MSVWTSFGLRSNLGLTKGILVILAEKCTSGAPIPEWVAPRRSGCSHRPMERKWYFWIFRGLTSKSRVNKIRYQQLPFLYLISRVQWEVSDKERDFEFYCPQINVWRLFMDRDRTLPAWPDLLQLLSEYFLDMSLHSGRGEGEVLFLFIFFFRVWMGWRWLGQHCLATI